MNFFEFQALCLTPAQKVILTLKKSPRSEETEDIVCFFSGYKTCYGQRFFESCDELMPIFRKPTSHGKISSAYARDFLQFDEIVKVTPADSENISLVKTDKIDSVVNGLQTLDDTLFAQCEAIVREMNELFPDIKIPFDEGDEPNVILYTKDGITNGLIQNICIRGGELRFTVNDMEFVSVCTKKDIAIHSIPDLLRGLMMSIKDPTSDMQDICGHPFDLPYNEIPAADAVRHPVLTKLGLLETLRHNKWWYTLSEEKRQGIISELQSFISRPLPNWEQATDSFKAWVYQQSEGEIR